MDSPLNIFFSYAHKDAALMNDVRRQLIVFERNGLILKWLDRMIPSGSEWRNQIDSKLEVANIILLFMSPDFIESRYCYEIEGQAALRRQQVGEARVIPIILRPCAWEDTPFGALQALPTGAIPISRWQDRDEACLDTARGVMRVVDELTGLRTPSASPNILPGSTKASPAVATRASGSGAAILVYCQRCGKAAGEQSFCTAGEIHHKFASGFAQDYCQRCGEIPGSKTFCTGGYRHHQFARSSSKPVFCSRCGAQPSAQTFCTGGYLHHEFVEMVCDIV